MLCGNKTDITREIYYMQALTNVQVCKQNNAKHVQNAKRLAVHLYKVYERALTIRSKGI